MTLHRVRQSRSLGPGVARNLNYGSGLRLAATLSCLANTVGWSSPPAAGLYLVARWSIVGIAAGNFAELLFRKVLGGARPLRPGPRIALAPLGRDCAGGPGDCRPSQQLADQRPRILVHKYLEKLQKMYFTKNY